MNPSSPDSHSSQSALPSDRSSPTEGSTAGVEVRRLVDANANRASEGLRVIEDYVRFVLDDGHLAGCCKRMRHALTDTLSELPDPVLSRDAGGDVGRPIKTDQEFHRPDAGAVLHANIRRVQQAFRSLEEWSKLTNRSVGRAIEALRYQAYELESAVVRLGQSQELMQGQQLYVLVDGGRDEADFQRRIAAIISAGVPLIQLRDKQLDDRNLLRRSQMLVDSARGTPTKIIINERIDVAKAVGAQGVHLGQNDLPVSVARRLLGPELLVGVSTHGLDQARTAIMEGASYLGVGPIFPSQTKSFDDFPGLRYARAVAAETRLPCFAIGGISLTSLDDVLACGICRVAVSSAIWNAESIEDVCRQFTERLEAVQVPVAPSGISAHGGSRP